MLDAAENYKIDGVQLDDHFSCPSYFSDCNEDIMT